MPLPQKVKSRIPTLSLGLLALSCVHLITANEDKKAPRVAELAVNSPKPPTIAPPILDKALPKNTQLRIDLTTQRLQLLVDQEVAIDSPISSGRKDFPTPAGKFQVAAKELKQKPGDYGNCTDSKGKVVITGIYQSRDPIPSGLRFQAVHLDHVFQIKDQKVKIHGGATSSLPISMGDIIVPSDIAKLLFAKVYAGCPIEITGE